MGRWFRWRDPDFGSDEAVAPPYGTYSGDINDPTNDQLPSSQVGILYMSPDQGGHTSMPVFGIAPKSLQCSAVPALPAPSMEVDRPSLLIQKDMRIVGYTERLYRLPPSGSPHVRALPAWLDKGGLNAVR